VRSNNNNNNNNNNNSVQFNSVYIYYRANLTAQVPIIKPAQKQIQHKNNTITQKRNTKRTKQKHYREK
jgi:hypothetical protein